MGSRDSENPDKSRKRTQFDPVDPLVAKGLRFNGFMGQTEHHYLNLRTIKLDLIKPQPQESLVRNERERVILLKKTSVIFVQGTIEEY